MTDLISGQAAGLCRVIGEGKEALDSPFLVAAMPTRRFIDPVEDGVRCAYLRSDIAKSTTGAPIPIDGGWTAHDE